MDLIGVCSASSLQGTKVLEVYYKLKPQTDFFSTCEMDDRQTDTIGSSKKADKLKFWRPLFLLPNYIKNGSPSKGPHREC